MDDIVLEGIPILDFVCQIHTNPEDCELKMEVDNNMKADVVPGINTTESADMEAKMKEEPEDVKVI